MFLLPPLYGIMLGSLTVLRGPSATERTWAKIIMIGQLPVP